MYSICYFDGSFTAYLQLQDTFVALLKSPSVRKILTPEIIHIRSKLVVVSPSSPGFGVSSVPIQKVGTTQSHIETVNGSGFKEPENLISMKFPLWLVENFYFYISVNPSSIAGNVRLLNSRPVFLELFV